MASGAKKVGGLFLHADHLTGLFSRADLLRGSSAKIDFSVWSF